MFKILTIDDDPVFLELLRDVFELEKFEVKALSTAKNINQEVESFSPDVILLDLTMPDVSGIEACQNLHGHYKNYEIPIILLSCMDIDTVCALKERRQLGVVETLRKPVEFSTLISFAREAAGNRIH